MVSIKFETRPQAKRMRSISFITRQNRWERMASNLGRDGDLQDFLHAHRPHGSLTADAVTFEHWITPPGC